MPNQSGLPTLSSASPEVGPDGPADRITAASTSRPTPTNTFFVRYIYSNRSRFIPGAFGGIVDGTAPPPSATR
jgi:hypothetical protein